MNARAPRPVQPFHVRSADRAKATFLHNVGGLNLSRLFSALIDPDRRLTSAEKRLAEYVMDSASE